MTTQSTYDWTPVIEDYKAGMQTYEMSEKYKLDKYKMVQQMARMKIKRPVGMKIHRKHNWQAIVADLESGILPQDICKKYNVHPKTLRLEIDLNYPHLSKNKKQKIPTPSKPKPQKPSKDSPAICPVMLKINVIMLHNKRTSIYDIAKQLSVKITQVNKILSCAKKRISTDRH